MISSLPSSSDSILRSLTICIAHHNYSDSAIEFCKAGEFVSDLIRSLRVSAKYCWQPDSNLHHHRSAVVLISALKAHEIGDILQTHTLWPSLCCHWQWEKYLVSDRYFEELAAESLELSQREWTCKIIILLPMSIRSKWHKTMSKTCLGLVSYQSKAKIVVGADQKATLWLQLIERIVFNHRQLFENVADSLKNSLLALVWLHHLLTDK